MKITKLPDYKITVVHGIDTCPFCKEYKYYQHTMEGIEGISKEKETIVDGYEDTGYGFVEFIETSRMYVDKYHCHSCGAEWESDPYSGEY